jgi:hypothetical protein
MVLGWLREKALIRMVMNAPLGNSGLKFKHIAEDVRFIVNGKKNILTVSLKLKGSKDVFDVTVKDYDYIEDDNDVSWVKVGSFSSDVEWLNTLLTKVVDPPYVFKIPPQHKRAAKMFVDFIL